jgi:hypothetical protein
VFEQIWTFLHIGVMFTAVGVSVVPELLLHRMAESGDVTGVRSFGRVFQRLGKLIPLLFGLGALLGLAAAYFSHFDLLRPWLIIAYVLFAISAALGGAIQAPWAARLGAAAAQSPADAPSAEFIAVAHDSRSKMANYAVDVIIVVFIVDMVFKPFGL